MVTQRFGSAHTEEKLGKLEEYLRAYCTALKHQNFRLLYFDAFAGTGDIQVAPESSLLKPVGDYSPFIEGSVHRALRRGTAFDQYIFVESSQAKVQALQALKHQYKDVADRILIRQSDANDELQRFCAETKWTNTRAVVFLDPYGNQVKWTTIKAIAETQAVDLWYLFPAGLGVYRQIGKDAHVETDERMAEIAKRCGFSDEDQMRVAFARQVGIPPTSYRSRFAA